VNALSLRTVAADALAHIGVEMPPAEPGQPRETLWLPHERGDGAQAVMGGRQRTVTIGPALVLSEVQAIALARRVLAHAMVGDDPAATRQPIRTAPD